MNKNSVMKYLFFQAKVCFGWCIKAEYHIQRCNYIVTDHIVDRQSTKFKVVHLQSNRDSMKPA